MTSDPRPPSAPDVSATPADTATGSSSRPGEVASTAHHPLPTDHPGDPNVELEETRFNAARDTWCKAYVHVWSDLSRGSFDQAAVEQAADEHWKRSPESDPVQVAVMAFMQPDKADGAAVPTDKASGPTDSGSGSDPAT